MRPVDMQVGVVDLFREVMIVDGLIELRKQAGLAIRGRLVVNLLVIDQELRSVGRRNEIQLAIFVDTLCGSKPKCFVANHGATRGQVVVPAQKIRNLSSGNIRTVESIVPMVRGG